MSIAYPATIPGPIVQGMTLSPKKQNISLDSERGGLRSRIASEGEVYVLQASFVFRDPALTQLFHDFLRVTTSYGDKWFTANWLLELGFTLDDWAFKFLEARESKTGYTSRFNCTLLAQPAADADLEDNDWPFSDPDPGFVAERYGVIAPSSVVVSAVDASNFNIPVGEVAAYRWIIGWVIELYHLGTGDLVSGPRTISGISGDQITVSVPFGVTPTTEHGIRFAEYNDVVASQKAYAFASDDDNDFPDTEPPYVIMGP